MWIVPKINSNDTFYLFSGSKEIEFTIYQSEIRSLEVLMLKERLFIEETFGIEKNRKEQKAQEVVRLKNKGFDYRKISEKTGISQSWARQLYLAYS